MSTVGSINVNITARTEKFERGISRSTSALNGFAKRAASLGPAVAAGIAGAAVVKAAGWYASRMQELGKATDSLTQKQLDRVNEFNGAVSQLRGAVSATQNKILIDIAPAATEAVNILRDTVVYLTGNGKVSRASGSQAPAEQARTKRKPRRTTAVVGGRMSSTGPAADPNAPLRPGFAEEQMRRSRQEFPARLMMSMLGGHASMLANTGRNAGGVLLKGLVGAGDAFASATGASAQRSAFLAGQSADFTRKSGGRNQKSIDQLQRRLDAELTGSAGPSGAGSAAALLRGTQAARTASRRNLHNKPMNKVAKNTERTAEAAEALLNKMDLAKFGAPTMEFA